MSHSSSPLGCPAKRPNETAHYHQEAIIVAEGHTDSFPHLQQQRQQSSRSQVVTDHQNHHHHHQPQQQQQHQQQYQQYQQQQQQHQESTTPNDSSSIATSQGGEMFADEEDEHNEEDELVEDELNFDYKQVLTNILNEKKLALSNSPSVIRFLSSNCRQRSYQDVINIEIND